MNGVCLEGKRRARALNRSDGENAKNQDRDLRFQIFFLLFLLILAISVSLFPRIHISVVCSRFGRVHNTLLWPVLWLMCNP